MPRDLAAVSKRSIVSLTLYGLCTAISPSAAPAPEAKKPAITRDMARNASMLTSLSGRSLAMLQEAANPMVE
ncbi:hypothetical protein G6F31_019723 [Rhizopus arrhizus]|nr:hypothetical protein G6F31_019723 [Rhizopus arrhizus]